MPSMQHTMVAPDRPGNDLRDQRRSVRVMPKTATADRVDRDALLEFLRPRHQAVLLTRRREGGAQLSPVSCGVDGEGRIVVSTYPQRAKVANARRDPAVSLCVLSSDWNGPWVQVDGEAEVLDLPEALEPLVEYYRSISGEHPDWDEYRAAMTPPGQVAAPDHGHRLGTHRDRRLPARGRRQALSLASRNESCQACEVPFVLTVDQRASRRTPTASPRSCRRLNAAVPTVLGFERTAGDEFQGVLADPDDVVDVVLQLVRAGGWSIGVGAGPVQTPAAAEHRAAGAGPAFLSARRAVDAAKQRPARLAVRGAVPADAGDAQAVLSALAVVVERRSDQAWEAIALVGGGPDAGRGRRRSSASPGRRSASGSPPVCGTSSATCARPPPACSPGPQDERA